jgi:pimeloyl-ACP methyl ester carboxylesterase
VVQLEHQQVTVDGVSVHAVTAGLADAPALLLVHGWPESWATWWPTLACGSFLTCPESSSRHRPR